MNWTAILALLAGLIVNLFQAFVTRRAIDAANDARAAVIYADQRVVEAAEAKFRAEREAATLTIEPEESRTLHRNLLARQSRSASRKVQHQERGNAAD